MLSPAVILSELIREGGLYLSGRALRAVQVKVTLLKQGVTLPRVMHWALLHCVNLVMQVSRQSMPSKDHQSYKAEQSLTKGQGKFPPEYCGLLQGGAVLPWDWKPTLPDSL